MNRGSGVNKINTVWCTHVQHKNTPKYTPTYTAHGTHTHTYIHTHTNTNPTRTHTYTHTQTQQRTHRKLGLVGVEATLAAVVAQQRVGLRDAAAIDVNDRDLAQRVVALDVLEVGEVQDLLVVFCAIKTKMIKNR